MTPNKQLHLTGDCFVWSPASELRTLDSTDLLMRFDVFLDWELTPIKLFLEEVPPFLENRSAEAAKIEPIDDLLGAPVAYRTAAQLALECVALQLNAVVDAGLLALANRVRSDESAFSLRDMKRSRSTLIAELEKRLTTKAEWLPGWDQVELLREEANALKHRAGLMIDQRATIPQPSLSAVQLSPSALMQRFIGSRLWLLAWWDLAKTFAATPRAV